VRALPTTVTCAAAPWRNRSSRPPRMTTDGSSWSTSTPPDIRPLGAAQSRPSAGFGRNAPRSAVIARWGIRALWREIRVIWEPARDQGRLALARSVGVEYDQYPGLGIAH
jgi:hypothetical protein